VKYSVKSIILFRAILYSIQRLCGDDSILSCSYIPFLRVFIDYWWRPVELLVPGVYLCNSALHLMTSYSEKGLHCLCLSDIYHFAERLMYSAFFVG